MTATEVKRLADEWCSAYRAVDRNIMSARDTVLWRMEDELAKARAALHAAIDELAQELRNIAEAKRFDGTHFDDDTSFADWAQSRARHALGHPTAPALQGVQAPTPSPSNIRLRACLSFFRSVIQSGESWTPTCDAMYTQAVDDTPLETRSGLADSARSDVNVAAQESVHKPGDRQAVSGIPVAATPSQTPQEGQP